MKGNILIAEDDFDIADLIRMYLENSGYQVFLAENGEKALEVMEQTPIDLAILDVMMPRMDGFALTRKIRETSGIPLIILSAKGKEEGRVFTKAQLYSCLNGEGLRSDDNTIMVHISNLREKIEEDPRRPALIRTIRGIGYKFDGSEKK